MDASEPVTRLTPREKEVLRAWLGRKSAKEIAIDLGITHHAVEKRLKMARVKLGAGSSLEAARMLAAAEGYKRTVPDTPDLSTRQPPRPFRRYRSILLGGIAMSLALVLAITLALAPASPPAPAAQPALTEIEVDGRLDRVFDHLDENRSGYLESPESPFVTVAFADGQGAQRREGKAFIAEGSDPAQVAQFYADADTDGDRRISLAEYTTWSEARWAELGIEIKMIMKILPAPQS